MKYEKPFMVVDEIKNTDIVTLSGFTEGNGDGEDFKPWNN